VKERAHATDLANALATLRAVFHVARDVPDCEVGALAERSLEEVIRGRAPFDHFRRSVLRVGGIKA
jgi:hypothetical protein